MPPQSPSRQEDKLSSSAKTTRPGQPQQQNPGAPDGAPAAAPVGAQPPKEVPTPEAIKALIRRQDAFMGQFGKQLPTLDPHVPTEPSALEVWRGIKNERFRIVDLYRELHAQEHRWDSEKRQTHPMVPKQSEKLQAHPRIPKQSEKRQAHPRIPKQSEQGQAHPTVPKQSEQGQAHPNIPKQPEKGQAHSTLLKSTAPQAPSGTSSLGQHQEQTPGAPAVAPAAPQRPDVDTPPRQQYTAQELQTAINVMNSFARSMGCDLPILPTLFPPEDPVLRAEWNEIRVERARIVRLLKEQQEREEREAAQLTNQQPATPTTTAPQAPAASSNVASGTSSQVMHPASSSTIGKQEAAAQTMAEGGPDRQKEKRKREDEENAVYGTVLKKAKE